MLIACEKSQLKTFDTNVASSDSLTTFTNTDSVKMELIQNGYLKVKLFCSEATKFTTDDARYSILTGPVIFEVFDEAGMQTMHGQSLNGLYYEDTAEFNLIGNVRVFTKDNRRLFTEDTLIWNQQSDLLKTNNFTIVVTPSDSISGYGLISNMNITEYEFRKISGKVAVEE